MNAFARDLRPIHPAAMARDLLGFSTLAASPVAYHSALSSRDSGGPLSLADATYPAGWACDPHVHAAEDELLVVLSGEVELTIGGRRFRRAAGEPAFIPRGTEHALRAVTEARVMAILSRERLDAPLTERVRGATLRVASAA